MKRENLEYIMKEILPNDEQKLWQYAREQAAMVLGKLCIIKGISEKDNESIELEAMILSGVIHTGLIDFCLTHGENNK